MTIELDDGFTNPCECGEEYNGAGQRLTPRSQWGEETGESLADIFAPGDLLCPDEERYADLAHDARVVNDYIGWRIRSGGCGLLRDPRMQRRYPHINDQREKGE